MTNFWKRLDNFSSKNMEFVGFLLIAINFGMWQHNFNAGCFVLISMTTANLMWRKRILERNLEDDFGETLDNIMDKLGRLERKKGRVVLFKPGDSITH
jgi:protein-S-isoprenylcysteine O-methyltransferase Ste14